MKTLVALCPYVAYRNEQLLKDCVLIPYSFTNLGYQVKLVTAKKEELAYLKYLPKLTLPCYHVSNGLTTWSIILKIIKAKLTGSFALGFIPTMGRRLTILSNTLMVR